MSWIPKCPSIYTQKMARLSCKIFGQHYEPPMPVEIASGVDYRPKAMWQNLQVHNRRVVERTAQRPLDLDTYHNPNYYPPHPQIRELVYVLRQYGLFRDEHMDFVEEMKRLKTLRGKQYRKLGGMTGKRAQLKAKK